MTPNVEYVRYIRTRPPPDKGCCGGRTYFVAIQDGTPLAFGQTSVEGATTRVTWLETWLGHGGDLPTTIPTCDIRVVRG